LKTSSLLYLPAKSFNLDLKSCKNPAPTLATQRALGGGSKRAKRWCRREPGTDHPLRAKNHNTTLARIWVARKTPTPHHLNLQRKDVANENHLKSHGVPR